MVHISENGGGVTKSAPLVHFFKTFFEPFPYLSLPFLTIPHFSKLVSLFLTCPHFSSLLLMSHLSSCFLTFLQSSSTFITFPIFTNFTSHFLTSPHLFSLFLIFPHSSSLFSTLTCYHFSSLILTIPRKKKREKKKTSPGWAQ